jgi:hypothetical protein
MATYPDGIGGGTLGDIGSGYLANYMPTVWAKEARLFLERRLVTLPLFNRDYEKYLNGGGDTIIINPLLEVTGAAVNTNAAPVSYDTDQGTPVSLIINFWWEAAVGVNDFQDKRGVPDYKTSVLPTLTYTILKKIDSSICDLFSGFTNYVGTDGVALTYEALLEAKEYLDTADVPPENRVLILDPGSLTDLMLLDTFTSTLYDANRAIERGFLGQSMTLGCTVHVSNNLAALNTNYHYGFMGHKDAIAVALPDGGVKTARWRVEEQHTEFNRASAWWGRVQLRDTNGVYLKTRT